MGLICTIKSTSMHPLPGFLHTAGASFLWDEPLNEARFHARVCLLAVVAKQQYVASFADKASKNCENDDADDSDDLDSETDTIAPRQIATSVGPSGLRERFLDRLAELLSREKTSKGAKNIHTAATVMFENEGEATVYVAKNGGLDILDHKMINVLQLWLRAIAVDGKWRDVSTDRVWKELLKYHSERLGHYRQKLGENLRGYVMRSNQPTGDPLEQKLLCLQRLCCYPMINGAGNDDLHDIVCLAHELRQHSALMPRLIDVFDNFSLSHKTWQWIMLLSRIRTTYDTFVENALYDGDIHASSFRNLRIIPGSAVGVPFEKNLALSSETMQTISSAFKDLKNRQQKQLTRKYMESCFVHAEVQLLMQSEHLSPKIQRQPKPIEYMGCSKKTCYLCCLLLAKHGHFRTRGTHGKVYHRWTVPADLILQPASMSRVKEALLNVEHELIERFEDTHHTPQLAEIPESSIGAAENIDPFLNSDKRRNLEHASGAQEDSHHQNPTEQAPLFKLGKARDTFLSLRIPSIQDERMEVVRLTTHEVDNDYDCCDRAMLHVPDFSRYWGVMHNFDRGFSRFAIENQTPRSLNGDYRIFWNTNDDLPVNETLKSILGLEEIPCYRNFCYGDMFIERIGEDEEDGYDFDAEAYHLYDDVPPELQDSKALRLILQRMWDYEIVEQALATHASVQDFGQQHDTGKDLVYSRMYDTIHFAMK